MDHSTKWYVFRPNLETLLFGIYCKHTEELAFFFSFQRQRILQDTMTEIVKIEIHAVVGSFIV